MVPTVPAFSAAKSALVGANRVNGRGLLSTFTKPAGFRSPDSCWTTRQRDGGVASINASTSANTGAIKRNGHANAPIIVVWLA